MNSENVLSIADSINRVLLTCNEHPQLWKEDKYKLLEIVQNEHPIFYETYPRVCRGILFNEDIFPLLEMLEQFGKVQSGEKTLEEANNLISKNINDKYITPVLNSEKLVSERDSKISGNRQDDGEGDRDISKGIKLSFE